MTVVGPGYEYHNSTRNYFDGDKGAAWEAVRIAYTKRLTGPLGDFDIPPTDFDYAAVARAADAPADSTLRSHQEAFQSLKKLFQEEWSAWCSSRR